MTKDYDVIRTTPEVWAVIHASHKDDLMVHSTFSDPTGTFHGGPGIRGEMFTAYAFWDSDYPLMEATTTWEIDKEKPSKRINEQCMYSMCIPRREKTHTLDV